MSKQKFSLRRRFIMLGALIGAGFGVAVGTGVINFTGNEQAASTCQAPNAVAQAMKPFIEGQIAGLQINKPARHLGTLAYMDANKNPVTMDDKSGKIVLFNLWATWCAPCRAEMPALDRLQAQLGGDDFEVVAVNIDTGAGKKVEKFLTETNIQSLALYRDPALATYNSLRKFGLAPGLPSTLILDRQGCLAGAMAGPAEWDAPEALSAIRAAIAVK